MSVKVMTSGVVWESSALEVLKEGPYSPYNLQSIQKNIKNALRNVS